MGEHGERHLFDVVPEPPAAAAGRDLGPVFAASYDGGECDECGDDILEGDEVLFVDGDLTHYQCLDT